MNNHYFFSIVWRDCLEIGCFAIIIYKISLLLAVDKQKNLLLYFYGYLISIAVAYVLQLATLGDWLVMAMPMIGTFFVIFHQERLQKNFIVLHKIQPPSSSPTLHWPETLIRGFLYAMNNNKALFCVVEQKDLLPLTVSYEIDAVITLPLLQIIIDDQHFDQKKMLWIKNNRLFGIHAECAWHAQGHLIDPALDSKPLWIQDAILLTSKTDSLCIGIDPKSRLFTLVAQGKLLENINTQTTLRLINNYCGMSAVRMSDEYTSKKSVNKYMEP